MLAHVAVTWWVFFCYNFHHLHRGLRLRAADGVFVQRTPAMALGIAKTPLSVANILMQQTMDALASARPALADFRPNHATCLAP